MSAKDMHHEDHEPVTHPFHLVNPSPLPIMGTFAIFFMALGGLLTMHNKSYGPFVLGGALIYVFYVLYRWWKEVIREGMYDKAHNKVVQTGLRIGMALFILSEVMFFFGFFFSFFKSALVPMGILEDAAFPLPNPFPVAAGVWPPKGIHTFDPFEMPLMNTLILLLSGTTVTWAHHALLHNDRKSLKWGLGLTVALGFFFTLCQAYEYHHAAFKFTDGVYASNFFMATGFHGFHVIVGTLFLLVCWKRSFDPKQLTVKGHLGFEFAAWYWHFVDVVWLFLFVAVYIWGGGGAEGPAHH